MGLLDPGLAERLARAAVAAGGGFRAQFVLCRAIAELGTHHDIRSELTALATLAIDDFDRTRAGGLATATLFWTLSSPTDAEAALDGALEGVADPACRLILAGQRSIQDAVLCRPETAVTTALDVLTSPLPVHPVALALACWALATARGGLGRLDGLATAVQRIDAASDAFEPGILRINGVGNAWTRALRLAGLLADAEREARGHLDRLQDAGGTARPISEALCGLVALDQGRVRTAARILRETGADLTGRDSSWTYITAIGRTLALGMAGDGAAARQACIDMEALRHPALVFREPDLVLARAWAAAAEGALSQAIALARLAAETAASQTQPAVEVVALHTAVCFGDRTVAGRLAELAAQVDGPRAPAAAAHAAALATDHGDALHAASMQLEDMGALLLAADAAAHAAAAHTRTCRRGSARTALARAHRLAERCEGARTPALAMIGAPPGLTQREREIVTLAAGGLSNRAIAARLVVSVRTVEGHLYRACAKLGTSDRSEFSALLRTGST